jgi:hypothetical protein
MKSSVFWDTTLCSPLKVNGRFGGTSRLHLQGRRISHARNRKTVDKQSLQEATCSIEMSVDFQRTTRCYNSQLKNVFVSCMKCWCFVRTIADKLMFHSVLTRVIPEIRDEPTCILGYRSRGEWVYKPQVATSFAMTQRKPVDMT